MTANRPPLQDTIVPFKSWRDLTPLHISVGTTRHNKTGSWRFIKPVYEDKTPACQNACPAGNDIEGWIRLVQAGRYREAFWLLKREQPFPAVLGRVCFKFCQLSCNRKALDANVGITALERFVGDQVGPAEPHPDLPAYNGKSLAVIGSGPAGMANAYFARLLGFKVTIFEALPEPGGILRYGIPDYRLARGIVAREFEGLGNMGIEIRTNTVVGKDIPLRTLARDFDYLFLATGVHKSIPLKLGAATQAGAAITSGLDFLKKVALGQNPDIGRQVVVVGGGNTAIDAARTAVRLGATVTVLYRRTEQDMPAHPAEVAEAKEEGVVFRFLADPLKVDMTSDGRTAKLNCCKVALAEPDESGRRRPVRQPDDTFDMKADTIISAIGEKADLNYLKGLTDPGNGKLAVPPDLKLSNLPDGFKVYAGGDIIDSPHTVVHAVAAGKRAAIAMDCDAKSKAFEAVAETITVGQGPALSFSAYMGWDPPRTHRLNRSAVVPAEKMVLDYFNQCDPVVPDAQPAHERVQGFNACEKTFSIDQALQEAARCMHCGRCTECDNCLVFCPDLSVRVRGNGDFGYVIDYDYCKGCGICAAECPRGAITMLTEETSIAEKEA